MFPPMLLYLRVRKPGTSGVGVWLPLFLVWLILLPIVVPVFVVAILVDLVLFVVGARYHHYTLLLLRCLGVLNATRGTVMHVRSDRDIVEIDLV